MCGRYALSIRAQYVRQQFQEHNMQVDEIPEEDQYRQSYNFAPGYHGLVYRADVPNRGLPPSSRTHGDQDHDDEDRAEETSQPEETGAEKPPTKFKLQSMQWGLIPFWTKRNPGYGNMLKTINARDDSLAQSGGMWNTMKKTKRCIVVAQGFFEWQKKSGTKIPHFVKRKDGQLMCFAGLWDSVQYEGSDEKLFTYSIITTDVCPELRFLHDRMPAILDEGSKGLETWLDPDRTEWSKELQSLLKPFEGELEYYPVSPEVGKVGNNSPTFIVPVDSSENKNNIANFFGNTKSPKKAVKKEQEPEAAQDEKTSTITTDVPRSEDNAPMPIPEDDISKTKKRQHDEDQTDESRSPVKRAVKIGESSPAKSARTQTPTKLQSSKRNHSATTNNTPLKASPAKSAEGNAKITNFFGK